MAALYADRVLALRDGTLSDYTPGQEYTQPSAPPAAVL
jgi:ABC-type enterochelin transport system ATPase subunit